jgi:hypothetical protein
MTWVGTIKNGAVILDPGLVLPDGTRVRVVPLDTSADFDPADNLPDLAVSTGIPDLASEHDHYIYGTPKRGELGRGPT